MTRPEQAEKLPRNIGLWGIWLLTVNGLIGAGIFGLPSGAASLAGGYSPAAFLVCALVMLPVVLCFAEAGSYFRSTGGPIRYSTEAFGPFVGFQAGWLLYVSRLASLAANSVLLVDSVGFFWAGATAGTGRFAALASIWFSLVFLNVIGSVRAIRSLAVLTAAKLTALLLLVGMGIAYFGRDLLPNAQTEVPAAGEFAAATLLLIYAYAGFESVGIPAGETRRPSRDIPIALLLGLGSVALVYVAIQMVSIAAVPDIAASTSPLLDVANALMGPVGSFILMLGVVASVGGNLLGGMFATPRLSYAIALDGNLPKWFGAVHPRFLTPANSTVLFGSLAFVLAVYGSFIWLAAAAVVSRLFVYAVISVSIPRLRKRHADREGFVLPGGYAVPALAIAACAWLLLQVSRNSLLAAALAMVLGSVLYAVARRRSSSA